MLRPGIWLKWSVPLLTISIAQSLLGHLAWAQFLTAPSHESEWYVRCLVRSPQRSPAATSEERGGCGQLWNKIETEVIYDDLLAGHKTLYRIHSANNSHFSEIHSQLMTHNQGPPLAVLSVVGLGPNSLQQRKIVNDPILAERVAELYRQVLHDQILASPLLASRLQARYTDDHALRFIFNGETQVIEAGIRSVLLQAQQKVRTLLHRSATHKRLTQNKAKSITNNKLAVWVASSLGPNMILSDFMAQRLLEQSESDLGSNARLNFMVASPALFQAAMHTVSDEMTQVNQLLKNNPQVLTEGKVDPRLLRQIALLAEGRNGQENPESILQLTQQLRARFTHKTNGLEQLDDKQMQALVHLAMRVEALRPATLVEKEIRWPKAESGGIAIIAQTVHPDEEYQILLNSLTQLADGARSGAKRPDLIWWNALQEQRSLARKRYQQVDKALRQAISGQMKYSGELVGTNAIFTTAQPLTPSQVRKLTGTIASQAPMDASSVVLLGSGIDFARWGFDYVQNAYHLADRLRGQAAWLSPKGKTNASVLMAHLDFPVYDQQVYLRPRLQAFVGVGNAVTAVDGQHALHHQLRTHLREMNYPFQLSEDAASSRFATHGWRSGRLMAPW